MTDKYPSAEEVKRIVVRRKKILKELISCFLLPNERERTQKFQQLASRYSQADIERVMAVHRQRLQPHDLEDDEAIIYREYVDYYRRFGGQRPLLTETEFAAANSEFASLFARREFAQPLTAVGQARLDELIDLMLKEAPFWEDLVPENPPTIMPPPTPPLPSRPKTAPQPAAGHSESSYPTCPTHGFPMITINGQLKCSLEALDHCLGHKKVTDVVQRGKITYYIFEDGHELPLLCGCCGQGLVIEDVAHERKQVCGRRLEGIFISEPVNQPNKPEFNELILEFSRLGIFSKPMYIPVAFEVAAQLRHPGSTKPTSGKNQAQAKGRSGKKKGRKK